MDNEHPAGVIIVRENIRRVCTGAVHLAAAEVAKMRGMNALDHFLREHSSVHRAAVVRAAFNMDYLLEGLTDRQLRLRPHSLNSLAWIFWHVARTEDAFVKLHCPPARSVVRSGELVEEAGSADA
jgi:hypothetical protein